MKMTRPEFMDRFIEEYTEESVAKVIPEQSNLIYAIYSVLLESDLDQSDIKQVNCDNETVVVKLSSKELAKSVRNKFHDDTIRFGYITYKLNIKVDKSYLYVDLEEIPESESEE